MTVLIEFTESGFEEKLVLINPEDISSMSEAVGGKATTRIYLKNQTYYDVQGYLEGTITKLKPSVEVIK